MADTVTRSALLTSLIDPLEPTTGRSEQRFTFTGGGRLWTIAVLLGIGLLVVSAVGWVIDPAQFFFSYLVGWTFCLTLTLGALFFVMIQHVTKAYWVVAVRRIPEVLLWTFPLLALLALPFLLFGMHDLYHWTHHELFDPSNPAYDEILAGKQAYLNLPFYYIRIAAYFFVWIVIAYKLYTLSVVQDVDPDPAIPSKQRRVSAWGIPLFAVTTAFASYDLLMSLDPHWFSTIFGVYFFAGAFVSALAFVVVSALSIQRPGRLLQSTITSEHYHDLGKLLFGFIVFWAYIAFSQYMLYWYGNIPEETIWYRHRFEHGWGAHSAALLIAHFIIPFIVLLPRTSKRSPLVMGVMSVWMLVMHWFDLHWIALPVLHEESSIHWLDLTCWLGLFALVAGVFVWRLGRHALVPQNDPLLGRSLRFENA